MTLDWTEKHRPKRLADIIGNPKAVRELRLWAGSWEHGNPKKKALILAGSPGIGKTTSAYALSNDYEWGVIELNASDTRNYESVKRIATSGAINQTFTDDGGFLTTETGGRKLIILDEADNLFGNEDRGGILAIVKTINDTKQPIILIVNDLYSLKRRSPALISRCQTVKFFKIAKPSVIKTLREICQKEGINISAGALAALAERSEGDMRAAVRDLESLSYGKKSLEEKDVMALGYRDVRATIFDCMGAILRGSSPTKARESIRNLDEDPESIILWIDENIPHIYKDPKDLERAYEALSRADVFLGRVRRRQHYRMWSYASDMMTAGVNSAKTRKYYGSARFQFPSWLLKMSRTKEKRSVQKSILKKLGRHCHTSINASREDMLIYFSYLFTNEPEFRHHMAAALELEAGEVAALLDERADSATVKRVMEEAKNLSYGDSDDASPFSQFQDRKHSEKSEASEVTNYQDDTIEKDDDIVEEDEEETTTQKNLFDF